MSIDALALRGLLDVPASLADADWKPFRPGIDAVTIYEDGTHGAAAMLLRYAPGASAPAHVHEGFEHIFILMGSQDDERGHHPAGSLLIHPPGSEHRVRSDEGCIVLAIWEKRVRFLAPESPTP